MYPDAFLNKVGRHQVITVVEVDASNFGNNIEVKPLATYSAIQAEGLAGSLVAALLNAGYTWEGLQKSVMGTPPAVEA